MSLNTNPQHEQYLLQALQLAATRQGFTAPNPAVGCVVVKDGQVLATGVHKAAGCDHAERVALNKLAQQAHGATLYVTLEPCVHHGKTPPCTDIIIASGVQRVIFAFADPNPLVYQQASRILAQAGIQCEHYALPAIDRFYAAYQYWHAHQRPYVSAKLALSLDGKIAAQAGKRTTISGEAIAEFTHQQRLQHDAILTTTQTILADDPLMNVRLPHQQALAKPVYVLDSQLRLPADAAILHSAQHLYLFHNKHATIPPHLRAAEAQGSVSLLALTAEQQYLPLLEVMRIIGEHGKHTLWVEAGAKCTQGLLQTKLLQRLCVYLSPKVLGSLGYSAFDKAEDFSKLAKQIHWQVFAEDVLCDMRM
jgi:diaminohydroxyphosphoribosylaminopyrimidine deaminase/5-amino-6-(5-phosphoribosylamino)uracil reductase